MILQAAAISWHIQCRMSSVEMDRNAAASASSNASLVCALARWIALTTRSLKSCEYAVLLLYHPCVIMQVALRAESCDIPDTDRAGADPWCRPAVERARGPCPRLAHRRCLNAGAVLADIRRANQGGQRQEPRLESTSTSTIAHELTLGSILTHCFNLFLSYTFSRLCERLEARGQRSEIGE
jgi:hypothetical protein